MDTHCIALAQRLFWIGLTCGTGLGMGLALLTRLLIDSRDR